MILAADIGGTTARLALFEAVAGGLAPIVSREYHSADYAGLEPILAEFRREDARPIRSACFAVPGPVAAARATTTHRGWRIDAAALAALLGLPRVRLLNDLMAIGHGLSHLAPADLVTLNAGAPAAAGNRAVIAAGTGLGEAGCWWDGRTHHPFAGEGGHADFAPRDAAEFALFEHLRERFGRVSWERVLSGPGLVAIHRHLRAAAARDRKPPAGPERDAEPAAITAAALAGDALCTAALGMFVSIYGAEAGNLALKMMARGGVFVAGGIAPKIVALLRGGAFMGSFLAKGRMRPLLESIPVHVVMNEQAGLIGAAHFAAAAD
jgi:glucokinase